MIDLRLLNIDNVSLTIEKPVDKAIIFKPGEILKAQIADILPSGIVILKIKGNLINARTNIPLLKGFSALLKVTTFDTQSGELRLQLIEYADKNIAFKPDIPTNTLKPKESLLTKLILELSQHISNATKNPVLFEDSKKNILKLDRLHSEVLKLLPNEINSLPKETINELKSLLLASLRISGQNIQSRLEMLISSFPETFKNHPLVANIKLHMLITMDKLLEKPIKNLLHDTGVLLEARLRAIAELIRQMEHVRTSKPASMVKTLETDVLRQQASLQAFKQISERHEEASEEFIKSTGSNSQKYLNRHEASVLKNDLKAGLLKLKNFILNKSGDEIQVVALNDLTQTQRETALKVINTLIRDIEIFQLLSKITNSFYTFIPVNWKEARDGNLSFKKGKDNAGNTLYSCRINLELEKFGRLSAAILMIKGEFIVSFNVENSHLKTILINKSYELEESFRLKGLNLRSMNVMDAGSASIDYLEKLESFESSIDIKI